MAELPKLSTNELVPLLELRAKAPMEFFSNKTTYLKSEIVRYIKEKRVFRTSIMGETRGGKSEIGSTLCFWYTNVWNIFFNNGFFDNLDLFLDKTFKKEKLKFNVDFVCDNQQVYKDRLKKAHKNNILHWGQIWQIDEEKRSEGGVGSISDIIETQNLNNIIAKYNQSEIWIQPEKFETHNCPFGLKVVKKDEVKRVNWCLLFKLEQEPNGVTIYRFLGWVKIPLHTNEEFRIEYNKLKDNWIAKELKGRVDERMLARSKCAEMLVKKYNRFFTFTDKGKQKYSQAEQLTLLNRLMMGNKISTNFNEQEKYYIIQEARIIAEEMEGVER